MPKVYSDDFKRQILDFATHGNRKERKHWNDEQAAQPEHEAENSQIMYHKWAIEEEAELCKLVVLFSTDWEEIRNRGMQAFSVLQLKNKYREIILEYQQEQRRLEK